MTRHLALPRTEPTPPERAVAHLTTCLALVRPVGMPEADAADWLHTAAGDVAHLPEDILVDACREARRTCTHHAQIVPTIIRDGEVRLRQRRTIRAAMEPAPADAPKLAAPEPWMPTPEELAQLHRDAAARLSADR